MAATLPKLRLDLALEARLALGLEVRESLDLSRGLIDLIFHNHSLSQKRKWEKTTV